MLLDEWRGFHPYTTWSSINTAAAESVTTRFGIDSPIEHHGVIRTYLTRHGAGRLPTHDASLDRLLTRTAQQRSRLAGRFFVVGIPTQYCCSTHSKR